MQRDKARVCAISPHVCPMIVSLNAGGEHLQHVLTTIDHIWLLPPSRSCAGRRGGVPSLASQPRLAAGLGFCLCVCSQDLMVMMMVMITMMTMTTTMSLLLEEGLVTFLHLVPSPCFLVT